MGGMREGVNIGCCASGSGGLILGEKGGIAL